MAAKLVGAGRRAGLATRLAVANKSPREGIKRKKERTTLPGETHLTTSMCEDLVSKGSTDCTRILGPCLEGSLLLERY